MLWQNQEKRNQFDMKQGSTRDCFFLSFNFVSFRFLHTSQLSSHCLMKGRNETPHAHSWPPPRLAVLHSRATGANGRGTWKHCPWATTPLSSPKHSAHRVTSHVEWKHQGQVETRQAAVPCPQVVCPLGMLPCAIQGSLSASSSLHVKKWVGEDPCRGEGVFFPPHGKTFQPSQGGELCCCTPRLHLRCWRLQSMAEVAELGWQAEWQIEWFMCYALLQDNRGHKLFLMSLCCSLNATGSRRSLFCFCSPALIFCLFIGSKLLSKISLVWLVRDFASLMQDLPLFLTPSGFDFCLHQLLSVPGGFGMFQTT